MAAAASATGADLASVVKRKLDSQAAAAGSAQAKGRWIHHTGEDTIDETLEVYYCAYCGAHSLILDQLVSELPRRGSDQARVVAHAKHNIKLLLDEGPCVKIKRTPTMIEKQFRYLCKGCGLPLAYVSHPFTDKANNKYLYLVDGAFALTNAGKTQQQMDAEQEESERARPIVIPVFTVKRTPAAATSTTPATTDSTADTSAPASSEADATPAAAAATTPEPAAASSSATA